MGKFAPVAPIRILDKLAQERQLGPYHLLLAHDIIEHPDAYNSVFNRSNHLFSTIILDNSVIELGNAVQLDKIVAAAQAVNPTVLVLPDVLWDCKATYESIGVALPEWIETFRHAKLKRDYSFMMVPQGKTKEEFTECATRLAALAEAYKMQARFWWGIPRNFRDYYFTRQYAVDVCTMIQPQWPMHMLGFSDDVVDDFLVCANNKGIWGIDSAVPVRAASMNMRFNLFSNYGPRGDWWEDCRFVPGMIDNINIARRFAGG